MGIERPEQAPQASPKSVTIGKKKKSMLKEESNLQLFSTFVCSPFSGKHKIKERKSIIHPGWGI